MIPAPARATSLHGREAERSAVAEALARSKARAITVTGPLGIGKSRFVAEMGTSDARLRASLLADGTHGEIEVPLGVLTTPEGPAPAAVRRSPAVALLVDAAHLESERLDASALDALARLARASGGHPAALEQIAGWLGVLRVVDAAEAAERGKLQLLPIALHGRVRKAIAELDPAQREALTALAETSGPFDLEVASAAVSKRIREHLPAHLAQLAASGLLAKSGAKAALRWHLPRPFAALLRGPVRGRARRNLTAHYGRIASALVERDALPTSPALREARAEIVAAWEDARARKDPAEIALAVALSSLAWNGDSAVADHVGRIRSTLASHRRSVLRHRIEFALGEALLIRGDAEGADASLGRAAEDARRRGDVTLEALARIRRASLGPELGKLELAREQLDTGLALARTVKEPLVLELAVNVRGLLLRAAGDVHGALRAFGEEAMLARRIGNPVAIARSEGAAADCHLVLGETSLARIRYERALRAVRRLYPGWAHTFEGYIGLAAWEGGVFRDAVVHCRRALDGDLAPRFRVVFTAARAGALAEQGDMRRAHKVFARAEALLADDLSAAASQAVHAASLLLSFLATDDEASRSSARASIESHLASRPGAVSDEERAFVRALERTTRGKTATATMPDLHGRPLLEKVLGVLRDAKGKPVRAHTLFRAVWPDEPSLWDKKAEARVRKAISLLRELGLRGTIETTAQGYVLRG